jgi:hypothetical protein
MIICFQSGLIFIKISKYCINNIKFKNGAKTSKAIVVNSFINRKQFQSI